MPNYINLKQKTQLKFVFFGDIWKTTRSIEEEGNITIVIFKGLPPHLFVFFGQHAT